MLDDDLLDDPLIPYDWTAEEAYAVVTFLELLAEAVWCRHGVGIRAFLSPPSSCHRDPQQLSLPFHSTWLRRDPIPF